MNNIHSTQYKKMLFTPTSNSLKSIYILLFLSLFSFSLQAATVTWQGDVSSDWNTAGNWDINTVPLAGDYVIISNDFINSGGFMPIISTHIAGLERVVFDTGTTLTIAANGSLTVDGTGCGWCYGVHIQRNCTLTIEENASLSVSNTSRDGIYNYKGSIINDGDVHVYDTAQRGIYNYNNGTNNVGIMYLTNNGDILVENTGTDGIYSQIRKDTMVIENTGTIDVKHSGSVAWYNYAYQDSAFVDIDNHGTIRVDTTGLWNVGIYNRCQQTTVGEPVRLDFDNYGTIEVDSTHSYGLYNYAQKGELNFTNHAGAVIDIQNINQWGCYNNNNKSDGYTPEINFNNYGTITIRNTLYGGMQNYSNGETFNFNNYNILHISNTGQAGIHNYTYNNFAELNFVNDGSITIDTTGTSGSWYNSGIYNRVRLTQSGDTTSIITLTNNGSISIDSTNYHGLYSYAEGGDFTFINNASATLSINNTNERGIYSYSLERSYNTNNGFVFDNYGSINITNAGQHSIYNNANLGDFDFTLHANSILTIDDGGSDGIRNSVSNGGLFNFVNNINLPINNVGGQGFYNSIRTGSTMNFTNNHTIGINDGAQHGILNDNENGTLTFINHQDINIENVGGDAINNENDLTDNAYTGTFTFENRGNISINEVGDDGFYSHTNNMVGTLTNFAAASIDISNTDDYGWVNSSYGSGQLDFINQANATFKVDTTDASCFYNYAASEGTVNLTFDDVIDLDSCGVEGIYNLIRTNGTVNMTNNSTVDIKTVDNSGMWTSNENGNFNFTNNDTFNVDGTQQYNGIAAQSITTDTDLYTTSTTYTNNGTIDIKNVGSRGMESYTAGSTASFNIINDGTINIDETISHGIINNSHQGGTFTFENKANRLISIQNIGDRGLYNITNDASTVNFTNDGSIDIDNTTNAGLYNHTRDGFINFTNNNLIDIFNADYNAGFYNYTEQNGDEWTTELTFNNNGNINIEETEGHGLIFNTRNGTATINNAQNIDIENTLYRGLYLYNSKNNSERVCHTNFTNASTGNILLNNITEDGMYVYNYRDTTHVVNDGVIRTNQTGWRGMNVYSDNNQALLNFTNNGTIEVDTAGTEGFHLQCRTANEANAASTVLNFTNNGLIDIDSTKYEGFQTNGERGYIHLINGVDGEFRIRNTSEFGWHSYLYTNQTSMDVTQLIENYGLIDIAETEESGIQHYNNRANNHEFINQNSGIIRIANTNDKGLEVENYGNNTSYEPITNFTNHGLIEIDNVPVRSIEAFNNRGNTLNFANHGTIDLFKAGEYGIFNYAYNTSTSYAPVMNFDNWGTINIDSTGLAGIQNYNYQSKEVNFTQHAGDIHISRAFDHGIVNYPLENNRNYAPKVYFNMDGGSITIDDVIESGIFNFAYKDTIEVNITGGTININNTGVSGIYNYAYDDWAALTFNNAGTINTDFTGKDGIYNHNYNNSSSDTTSLDFTNTGVINTNNSTGVGIHNFNRSGTNFSFSNSGTLNLQNANREGLRTLNLRHNDNYSVTFDFENSGKIDINTTFQEGFRTANYGGDLTIDNTGVVIVRNSNREGIENVNYKDTFDFTNNGTIQVWDSKNEDLYNSALKIGPLNFTNGTCALIQVNGKIKNHKYANFVNDGIIMTAYDGFNDNKGTFTNNGIIEGQPIEYFETYGFQDIDDQGTILDYNLLAPLTGTDGQAIGNAINNPDAIYTIVGWFTDETLANSAGTYNSGSNTFTPSVGVGEHILYVQTTDNILSCTTARPVQVTINPVLMVEEQEIVVTLTPFIEENLEDEAAKSPSIGSAKTDLKVFPNPFTQNTNIQFQVGTDDFVTIEVYGMDGRQVAVLFEGYLAAGESQDFGFQAEDLRSGIYLVRMVTDKGDSKTLRVVLSK